MAIKKPVIVMALYDIGRDNWDNYGLSYNTYLFWMRNTLSLDANIVVYTEDKFSDIITNIRSEFDINLEKTKIVKINLEELTCYKLYNDKLNSLMSSEDFKNKVFHQVPEMTKPLYNIIMFNKVYFLKDAKDNNYFESDFFIWADAGGLRNDISFYKNNVWPSIDKINQLDNNKITFFSHSDNFVIPNQEFHAMSQIRYIQGTSFFVPRNMIDNLVLEFNETIVDCIQSGYIGSDEKIFDLTYCKNKDKYNLIKCTWRMYFDLFKQNGGYDNKKRIFLDLGTHDCQGLNHYLNTEFSEFKNLEIHTFEPNPLIESEKCVDSFIDRKINLHRKAVWVSNGKLIFNQYGNDGKSQGSLVSKTNRGKDYQDFYGSVEVESIDFYEFIKTLDSDSDIYIKMDIEWSEFTVLRHMLDNGWPSNIKKIWVEFHGKNDTEYVELSRQLIHEIEEKKTLVFDLK